jgi:undecaprenyl-diphosphatase
MCRPFLWINGHHHHPLLDTIMVFATGNWSVDPLFLWYCLRIFFSGNSAWRGFCFCCWRPWRNPLTRPVIRACHFLRKSLTACVLPRAALSGSGTRYGKGNSGGTYGFVHSHAANTFGVAVYLSHVFQKRWLSRGSHLLGPVGKYSRVYLGVHYPLDVLAGGLLGQVWAQGSMPGTPCWRRF